MLTLWCQGKPLPKLADASTSASMMLNMQILRYLHQSHLTFKSIKNIDSIINWPTQESYATVWNIRFTTTFTTTTGWWNCLGIVQSRGTRLPSSSISSITGDIVVLTVNHFMTPTWRINDESMITFQIISLVINALWANHKVHHSGEIYLLVNAFRVTSATDLILSVLDWIDWIVGLVRRLSQSFSPRLQVVFWPVALFVPPVVFIIHHQFNLIYQFWLHSGVIGKLGPIEWIFNTPSHHRVHHGGLQ